MKDLFPGSSVQELVGSAEPGWNAFNPSIAFSPISKDIKLSFDLAIMC